MTAAIRLAGRGWPLLILGVPGSILLLWSLHHAGGDARPDLALPWGPWTGATIAMTAAIAAGSASIALAAAIAGAQRQLTRRAVAMSAAVLLMHALTCLLATTEPWRVLPRVFGVPAAWPLAVAASLTALGALLATGRKRRSQQSPPGWLAVPERPLLVACALGCLVPAMLHHAGATTLLGLGQASLHPLWHHGHLALLPLVAGLLASLAGLALLTSTAGLARPTVGALFVVLVLRLTPLLEGGGAAGLASLGGAWWTLEMLALTALPAGLLFASTRSSNRRWSRAGSWLALLGALLLPLDHWVLARQGFASIPTPAGDEICLLGLALLVTLGVAQMVAPRSGLAAPRSPSASAPRRSAWIGAGTAALVTLCVAMVASTLPARQAQAWSHQADSELPTIAAVSPGLADSLPVEAATRVQSGGVMMSEVLHTKHYAKDGVGGADIYCAACHHKSKGTDVTEGCRTCHGEERDGDVLSVKEAQHRTCFRCHLEVNNRPTNFRGATGQPTDQPTSCLGCHENRAEPVERWHGLGERFPMVPDRLSCINW